MVCENSVGYFYILRKAARYCMNSGDCEFFGVLALKSVRTFYNFAENAQNHRGAEQIGGLM